MDLNRLTKGEKLLGAASALLFILSFFPLWAKVETSAADLGIPGVETGGSETARFSAWSAGMPLTLKIAAVLALVALVLVLVRAASPQTLATLPTSYIYLGLAGAALLCLALAALLGIDGGGGGDFGFVKVEVSRGILMLIGPLFGLAMAAGAYLHMQEEPTTPAATRGPMGGPTGPGPGPAGPPPPPGPGL